MVGGLKLRAEMAKAGRPAARPVSPGRPWSTAMRVAAGGLAGLLVSAAVYTSFSVVRQQAAMRQGSQSNVVWAINQAPMEVSRLQAALGAFALSRTEVERGAVELWLDMVASRVAVLRAGEAGAFVRGGAEIEAIVNELEAAIAAARPLLADLDDTATQYALMRALQRLNPRMARLASLAHARGAEISAQQARELARLHWQLSGLLIAVVVCCLILAGTAIRRNRLLAQANAEVSSLVADLRGTSARLEAANRRAGEAMAEVAQQNSVLQARDRELRLQNELFDAALNNMSQGLGMFDANHRLIVCNTRFSELLGLPAGVAVRGAAASRIFEVATGAGAFGAAALRACWAQHRGLAAAGRPATSVHEDEAGRSLWVSQRPMAGGGWVATYEDVTEARRAEARIRHLADHDALTGLPNRRHFNERLTEALAREAESAIAVLCLDLDHFKNVNDTLGHQAGDELLRAAAERIRASVRAEDIVARLGGDEFAVLMQAGPDLRSRAETLAARLSEALSVPFNLARYQASVGASVGIALAEPAASADALLKHADVALYRAKSAGRRTHRVFEASMAAELQARMNLERDLRSALERDELELHYQPLLDIRRGRLSGFEALLRWRHPTRGMVSPAEFVPVAEETGLIVPIGRWAMKRACLDAASFPSPVKVAVNISPVQFAGDDLVGSVREALTAAGLPGERLELEITESVLLQDSDAVVATLGRLRSLGPRISLDDFGTKYSSLSYLRSFPFDKIKVDQSFVRDMGHRPDCLAIVRSVARLATQLGMTATAEGVEDVQSLERVREAGCTEAQGYLFGRAEPVSALGRWFKSAQPPSLAAISAAAAPPERRGRRAQAV